MKRTALPRVCFLTAIATVMAVPHAARGQVRWLADEIPFIVSNEARDFAAELAAQNAEQAAIIDSIIDDAAARYGDLLRDHSHRIDALDGNLAIRFYTVWPEWRQALIELVDDGAKQIAVVLEGDSAEAWEYRENCYSYRQVVRLIHRAGLYEGPPAMPDLLEVLENAEVDTSPAGELRDVLAGEMETLTALAEDYWRDTPRLMRTATDGSASQRERDLAVARMNTIVDNLRDGTHCAAGTIAAALEDDARARFADELTCRQYPRFCTTTPVDAAVQLLFKCDSIDEQKRAAIEEHHRRYLAEHVALRAEFIAHQANWDSPEVAAQRDSEFQRLRDNGEDFYAAWRKHPGLPALRRLIALQHDTCDALGQLFTADEFARLPGSVQLALTWPDDDEPAKWPG